MTAPTNRANRAKILDVMEHRTCATKFEHREVGDGLILEGYAATYEPYDCYGGIERGGWIEQIQPTAFDVTLATSPDVQLLINHEGCPLARTKSGTLQLYRDRNGLRVRATLDRTDPDVQALIPKMRRGDMDEMSFGFRVKDQVWDSSYTHRTITEVSLQKGDVSVVNYGMNPTTHAVLNAETIGALAELSHADLVELRNLDQTKLVKALENLRAAAGKPDDGDADDAEEHVFEDGHCTTCRAKDPKKPYGNVPYADPANGKYPIDTAAHVKAAWSYINMPKNQKGYSSSQLASIKAKIKAAAKKFGIEISEDKKAMDGPTGTRIPGLDASKLIGTVPAQYSVPTPANLAGPRIEVVRDANGRESLVAIMPDGSTVPLPSQRADSFSGSGYVYDPPKDLLSADPQDQPYTKTGGANEPPEGDKPSMTAPAGTTLLSLRDDKEPDKDDDEADEKDCDNPHDDKIDLSLLAALESTIVHAYRLSIENEESTRTLLADAAKLIGRLHPAAQDDSYVGRQLRELRAEAGIPNITSVSEGLAYLEGLDQSFYQGEFEQRAG
jgi:HK97 family phage prohead protease